MANRRVATLPSTVRLDVLLEAAAGLLAPDAQQAATPAKAA